MMSTCTECGNPMHPFDAQFYEACRECQKSVSHANQFTVSKCTDDDQLTISDAQQIRQNMLIGKNLRDDMAGPPEHKKGDLGRQEKREKGRTL